MNEEHPEQKPASTPPPLNPPPPPFAAVPPSLNPTQYVPIPKNPNIRDLFEILLRRPTQLAGHQVCEEMPTLLRFGMIALLSILVFGFVLGTFAYHDQLWAAPLKMGGGMLFAGIICFPSLYIFSILAGSNSSAARMGGFLCGMLAMAGLLLLGFAPALWIFAQGTSSFGFMGGLGFASWLVALIFSFRFLRIALRETGATQSGPITIWCGIFLLVTFQLSTSLRPILGTSDKFLNTEKKFFLQHWSDTMDKSLEQQPQK